MVIGEVGLAGEVRGIHQAEVRIREASKLGFKRCLLPMSNRSRIKLEFDGIELIGIRSVEEALETLF
jgi:DNA repair protein RadA/Sms